LISGILFILALRGLSSPETSRQGNYFGIAGMIIAIVGQSGAGKTSLVNMLPGFYRPDVGSIQIDGTDISSSTLTSLRSLFGIVSQEVILFNDTVFNNIKYGKPGASFEDVTSASKAAYAHDFIMEFADTYNSIVGEKGVKLSGGQKQRLSIARAVLKNPPILILDEATSSLDTESEMKIQNALESLMKGRTTLVIAHRLSTVRKADMIITMERGKIVESGTHEELFARKGLYHKLYDLQFRDQEEVLQK
ncbi:MAG: NAD(P)(+) transhydrogenase (Re/Si-specific) subunit beta, partial [Candidatus Pacebacteria bacterium]|nr:NAD(P)(+) transhydrogenase (Re/Si-specific) subunit beta [Candidatus Paceibacterota bacterium]